MARLARRVQVENDFGEIMHYDRHTGGGFVSPHARVPESVPVGWGTYVEKGAVVGHGCRLGDGTWIDRDVVLGRDVRVGDNVRIAPGDEVVWHGTGAQRELSLVRADHVRRKPSS
ncbi:hypothetical protein AB0O99_19180, partial [Cellulosimicrobium funkei]